jgi:hypothetical protein
MAAAAALVLAAVDKVYLEGARPFEIGGYDGTSVIADRILAALRP